MNRPHYPLVPEVGIIALVADEWGDMWQPRQNILTRLGRYFRVLWLNPAREWRETLRRVYSSRMFPCDDHLELPPGFSVQNASPWLPKLYRPGWLARAVAGRRLSSARSQLVRAGCKKIVLYLWRAEFADALELIPADLSCYHIDDEYSFSDIDTPMDDIEKQLVKSVDHVFIHSPGLLEKKGNINVHTTLIPNGVDYQVYAKRCAEPADLSSIPRPRIGYTGWMKRQLDWSLLNQLCQRHAGWSFVFVGGQNPHPDIAQEILQLSRKNNVRFLGPKSSLELAKYPQHFDVSIMPYRANDYTKYIYPLKLHEYLASGSPVVGSRIRSLEDFEEVVSLARDPEEWSHAIAGCLERAAKSAERTALRQNVARAHDWDCLVAKIADIFAKRLDDRFCGQFAQSLDHGAARNGWTE